jgi:hypothetical protein
MALDWAAAAHVRRQRTTCDAIYRSIDVIGAAENGLPQRTFDVARHAMPRPR